MLAANDVTLRQIQSVRIGVVVRSEQYDKDWAVQQPSPTWSLFCNPGPCWTGSSAGGLPLPDLRNRHTAAQPGLESVTMQPTMANLSRVAYQAAATPKQAQRGVVLFIALIVMVALSLAAVALVRSIDTTNAVIGNLGFRMSSILPANLAVESATALDVPGRGPGRRRPHSRPDRGCSGAKLFRVSPRDDRRCARSAAGAAPGIDRGHAREDAASG